ncbi:BQ5605_C005g03238 [Microbotryum silenes-dioicae]|uniref:BQ5605_C005g03238 protein n=1 Tax=Microbotryum silenes-dioicae TaxID=796604 RepID=A0A2X0PC18_9BASI|nr:BQ5605_C005g03238 [Microbotryum silenes-dioicae]
MLDRIVGPNPHQTWTELVRTYETNTGLFVGTKTLRAHWSLRYQPRTKIRVLIGIGTEELQPFYATIVRTLVQECGEALLSKAPHVDNFAFKTTDRRRPGNDL